MVFCDCRLRKSSDCAILDSFLNSFLHRILSPSFILFDYKDSFQFFLVAWLLAFGWLLWLLWVLALDGFWHSTWLCSETFMCPAKPRNSGIYLSTYLPTHPPTYLPTYPTLPHPTPPYPTLPHPTPPYPTPPHPTLPYPTLPTYSTYLPNLS